MKFLSLLRRPAPATSELTIASLNVAPIAVNLSDDCMTHLLVGGRYQERLERLIRLEMAIDEIHTCAYHGGASDIRFELKPTRPDESQERAS